MTDSPLTADSAGAPAELTHEEAKRILRELTGQQAPPAAEPRPGDSVEAAAEPPPGRAPVPDLTSDAFRLLVESVPDALVVTDAGGRIVLVNAQTEQLFGYARDELLGWPVEVLVPERSRAKHVSDRTKYAAKPTTRPMGPQRELVGRYKDGREVPVEIGLSPLNTDAGPLVVASIRDVTQRRKAEAVLRKMEARYRTLVEGIPAVTFLASMDESEERELYVSPYIEKLLGFTQKEWIENPILWYTQLHPDDRERWHAEFAKTVARGVRFSSEYRFIARDGRVVWVRGEAQMVRNEAGQPLFLQGIAFDITEIKEANLLLEQRVKERTAELEAHSQELARSNRDLKQYAYAVSHDLLKPLRRQRDKLKELAAQYWDWTDPLAWETGLTLNAALARVDDMEQMIQKLLEFSEVRTKQKELVPVSCAEAVAWACGENRLRGEIEKTGATIECRELPVILGDKELLTLLFQNLIGNSLKFRRDDEAPEVSVTARREGAEWVIAVSDNGIGIKPVNMKSVKTFEKVFEIGINSRQHVGKEFGDKYPGHGIGLTTCKNIVEWHGGSIKAMSEGLGKGTTISFTLPTADQG
jgi:PAS domain S-box-containing protein